MGLVRGPPLRGLLWQMPPPRRANGMAEAHRRDRARALDRFMLQHAASRVRLPDCVCSTALAARRAVEGNSLRGAPCAAPGLLHLRMRCQNRIPCFLSHSTQSGSSAGMGDHPARMLLTTPCIPACLLVLTAERRQIGLQVRGKTCLIGPGPGATGARHAM